MFFPAPPKYFSVIGRSDLPINALVTVSNSPSGEGRSENTVPSAPGIICSKPTASTHSATPLSTACRAKKSAVDPLEQLLLTLTMGMPVIPTR